MGNHQKILGVVPGLSGAIASYNGYELKLLSMPTVKAKGRGRDVLWDKLADDFLGLTVDYVAKCYIEQVSTRPGEGRSSAFKFGYTAGGVRGMMAHAAIPVVMVTPQKWKKFFGLTSDKKEACAHAAAMFPENKKEFYGPKGGLRDGLAEAALIALYGYHLEIHNV